MSRPIIDFDECTGCGDCVDACPSGVLAINETCVEIIDEEECTACETCVEECPMGVISGIEEEE